MGNYGHIRMSQEEHAAKEKEGTFDSPKDC